ncbi:galactokinase isoform X5 [Anabrus simplex]|uniref:galactokinase isoform X5 n=1 Tax=Anabrus simplex TaxID=316456 RepID=UPI0034DDAD22
MASPIRPIDDVVKEATDAFVERFQCSPEVAACAPGRVNLIGEHTDYNGGYVLPMALPMVTVVVGKINGTRKCNILTTNQQADKPWEVEFRVTDIISGKPKWANYVKGSVAFFRRLEPSKVPGFDAVISSNVPLGGGLSSSAALEVAVFTFLEALTGEKEESLHKKAISCQEAEHVYAGMPCGIMDQFISVMGKENHALLIDCVSQQVELIPIKDPELVILVTNSNVRHELTGGEYATRRAQCQIAAKALAVDYLRPVSEEDLEVLKDVGLDDVIIRRARHVIRENKRTVEAAQALQSGNYEQFGKLMTESHISLRDDFEVSCPELDCLVDAAIEVNGVLGSRMTGGGFGGCTVTLVYKDYVENLIRCLRAKYSGEPTFYIVRPSEGCREIPLNKTE